MWILPRGDELKHVEAIIHSMTPQERRTPDVIDGSRRARISKGSGTSVQEVNLLLRQFKQMKKMIGELTKGPFGKLGGMFGKKIDMSGFDFKTPMKKSGKTKKKKKKKKKR